MRATAIALMYLLANLIGVGMGPLTAGALSDVLRPRFGDESLRYALLCLCPGYLWGGWYLFKASKTVQADLQDASASSAACPREMPDGCGKNQAAMGR